MIRVSVRPSDTLTPGWTIIARPATTGGKAVKQIVFSRRDDRALRNAWAPRRRRRRRHPLTPAGWIGLALILGALAIVGYAVWLSI